jgi:uncharacterized protein (TIGR03067 family)
MLKLALAPVLLFVIAVPADRPRDKEENDPYRLNGTWVVKDAADSNSGMSITGLIGGEWRFSGNQLMIKYKEEAGPYAVTADPAKKVPALDIRDTRQLVNGQILFRAIYQRNGDELRIAHISRGVPINANPNQDVERPTSFNQRDCIVFTMRRKAK